MNILPVSSHRCSPSRTTWKAVFMHSMHLMCINTPKLHTSMRVRNILFIWKNIKGSKKKEREREREGGRERPSGSIPAVTPQTQRSYRQVHLPPDYVPIYTYHVANIRIDFYGPHITRATSLSSYTGFSLVLWYTRTYIYVYTMLYININIHVQGLRIGAQICP